MVDKKPICVTTQCLKGLAVSPGVAVGPVCLFEEGRHNNMPLFRLTEPSEIDRELDRFDKARQQAIDELERIHQNIKENVGVNEAMIFHAHKVILSDEGVNEKIEQCVRENMMNIEYCVVEVFNEYEERIASMDDEYLKERGTDFSEIKKRLLDKLGSLVPGLTCQGEHFCTRGRGRVIVAKELIPSLTIEIDKEGALGFVTEHGGRTSHAAILANSLGIPAVSGISSIHQHVPCGTMMIVDGDNGEVWINPPQEKIDEVNERVQAEAEEEIELKKTCIPLYANINGMSDARVSIKRGAEGVGLFRTEFLFLGSQGLPNEDEQFEFYASVVKLFEDKPVTFRLLDVGGDKPLPGFNMDTESNPFLGWRGTRFLIDNPDILKSQIRAVARASAFGKVSVMYPMIADIRQLEQVRSVVRETFDDNSWESLGIPEGVMIEVPSIVFQLDEIAQLVDFFSIGTNDLIQYLFAVDRNNENVASSYDPRHPVLWEIIKKTAEAGRKHDIPVSVCGEMAGDPAFFEKFRDAGVTGLSMNPRMLQRVRRKGIQCDRKK